MSEVQWKSKFAVVHGSWMEIKKKDNKRKIQCMVDGTEREQREDGFVAEPATIASFHSSLKYASMYVRPDESPIADPFFQFPATRICEDLRVTPTSTVNSRRTFGDSKEWSNPSTFTDIVSNLFMAYRERLKNSNDSYSQLVNNSVVTF